MLRVSQAITSRLLRPANSQLHKLSAWPSHHALAAGQMRCGSGEADTRHTNLPTSLVGLPFQPVADLLYVFSAAGRAQAFIWRIHLSQSQPRDASAPTRFLMITGRWSPGTNLGSPGALRRPPRSREPASQLQRHVSGPTNQACVGSRARPLDTGEPRASLAVRSTCVHG